MQVSILQNGRVLRTIAHKGETYVEAPPAGEYTIRLSNSSPKRCMAVVSVDGVNILNGTDAGFAGPGYVLGPWQTVDVPGWRRDHGKVSAFTFEEQGASYAAQTGRGTANVGVVGVAVFEEKVRAAVPPIVIEKHHHHHHDHWPWTHLYPRVTPFWYGGTGDGGSFTSGIDVTCNAGEVLRAHSTTLGASYGSAVTSRSATLKHQTKSIGTAYGKETTFHTADVAFERATEAPAAVIALRYATRERLVEWGVPVDEPAVDAAPNPFPMSQGVPAPAGWRGA
jgi:hypothetical protein